MAGYSICLIGNSHLAALAQAWRKSRLGARPDVSLVSFGMRAGADWNFILQNGALVPPDQEGRDAFQRSSGRPDGIAIRDYECFVIYALGFQMSPVLSLFAEYGSVEDRKWGPVSHLISTGCLAAALHARMSGAGASTVKLLEQIRSVSRAPAIVCPMPFRSEAAFARSDLARHPRLSQPEYLARLAQEHRSVSAGLCAARDGDFLPQHRSTLAMPCFTKAEFALGGSSWGERKGAGKVRQDDRHMNDRFGAIALTHILRRLDELSGGAVLEKEGRAASTEAMLAAAE